MKPAVEVAATIDDGAILQIELPAEDGGTAEPMEVDEGDPEDSEAGPSSRASGDQPQVLRDTPPFPPILCTFQSLTADQLLCMPWPHPQQTCGVQLCNVKNAVSMLMAGGLCSDQGAYPMLGLAAEP